MLRVEFQKVVNRRLETVQRSFIDGRVTMPIYRGIVTQLRQEGCTAWASVWKDGEKLFTVTCDIWDLTPYFKQADIDIRRGYNSPVTVRSMIVE